MSRERMEEAMRELGYENDPTMRAVVSLLYATEDSCARTVRDQLASIGRMRKALGDPEHMLVQERRKA